MWHSWAVTRPPLPSSAVSEDEVEVPLQPGASHGWAGPSRSQKKRDARAVSDIGEALARLSAASLKRLPLDEELRAAVLACRAMQRGARARQLRLLGKLLRARDHAAIARELAEIDRASGAELLREKQAAVWRERLLDEGDEALAALVAEYPAAERHLLRRLLRQGRRELEDLRAQRARRELFRCLRALLAPPGSDAG